MEGLIWDVKNNSTWKNPGNFKLMENNSYIPVKVQATL